jgi:dTDP-4-dehydrorhamnose reductase
VSALSARPRILLIGADGQLGWELRRCFATLGDVTCTTGPVGGTSRIPGIVLDLADHTAIRRLMAEVKPRIVLNAAAYTAVDRAEDEVEIATAVNGTAPGILAREAARLNAWLVHYSTDYVFDGTLGRPYQPTDRPCPANAYGATKLQGEEAIRAIGGRHFILRTSWLYGPRGNNFLRTILRLIDARRALTVVNDQFGAPTWARNVAAVTAQIMAQGRVMGDDWLHEKAGTYHVTAAGRCSWYDFAKGIVEAYHGPDYVPGLNPISSDEYPSKAKRPPASVLDCSALMAAFGLGLEDWSDALARVMEEVARPPRRRFVRSATSD